MGPKLLKVLHNFAHFDLEPEAGAMGARLLKAIRQSDTAIVEFFLERNGLVPKCRNLSESLIEDADLGIKDIRQKFAVLI